MTNTSTGFQTLRQMLKSISIFLRTSGVDSIAAIPMPQWILPEFRSGNPGMSRGSSHVQYVEKLQSVISLVLRGVDGTPQYLQY